MLDVHDAVGWKVEHGPLRETVAPDEWQRQLPASC